VEQHEQHHEEAGHNQQDLQDDAQYVHTKVLTSVICRAAWRMPA